MADTRTTNLNLIKQDPNAVPDIAKTNTNLDTLDTEVAGRAKFTRYFLSTAGTQTHAFSNNSPFLVVITRAATTYTSMTGLYAGNAGSANGNVLPLIAPTADNPPTVSIDGRVLSVTTTAGNCNIIVIDLY